MGIIVDLIIIAVLALSIFLGYKKGFVKLAIKLCATIVAIILVALLYKPVSNFVINATNIDETIQNYIYDKATDAMSSDSDIKNESFADDAKDIVYTELKENTLPSTSRELAVDIVNIGVMVILFIIIKLLLRLVTALSDVITKLPIIKQFNKAGGIVYGMIRGFLIIFIVLEIISIAGAINPKNSFNQGVNDSFVGKMLSQNNVIDLLLK